MKIYTNDDVSADSLKGERVAIVGYGSQGRAHAQNLRDSGVDVIVGVRTGGAGYEKAKHDGLPTAEIKDAVKDATIIAILTPDMSHAEIYTNDIAPYAAKGASILFAHGFSVLYGRVDARPDLDVILVAPKGPGDLVRREYQRGRGVPSLFAVDRDVTGKAAQRAWAMPVASAARLAASLRRPSRKKPKPICSVSRPFCAVARPNWF